MSSIKWTDVVDPDKARRERIATAAMQGLLASVQIDQDFVCADVASDAIKVADALIAVLDAPTKDSEP